MTAIDEQIGRNLVALRGGMSQRDLAAEMQARDWKWTHVTVGSIERGERPLRAAEALSIVELFGVALDDLLTGREAARLRATKRLVVGALDHLKRSVSAWDEVRLDLAVLMDDAGLLPEEVEAEGQPIGASSLIGMTAQEVVAGVHESAKHPMLDYIASRTRREEPGVWTQRYIAAESKDHGQHREAP